MANYISAQAFSIESWDALAKADRQEERRERKPLLPGGLDPRTEKFLRKNLATIVTVVLIAIITTVTAVISYHNGWSAAEEKLSAEFAAEYAAALQAYKDRTTAAGLMTGEESRQAAIESDAKLLARIGQGVLNTYQQADLDDARKVMLCAVCRVLSGGEFASVNSIEDAVGQANQWWGFTEGMTYTTDVYDIALEVAEIYETGAALPCQSTMVYAGWNGGDIVLRNQWKADANARYY